MFVSLTCFSQLTQFLLCTQIFSYTKKKAFQTDDLCLDVSAIGGPVKLYQCHGLGGNQLWDYDREVLQYTEECCKLGDYCGLYFTGMLHICVVFSLL